ncbi:MAG: diol dehydratase reactivase ATPase-like domain-containing protein [Mycobacterium sp.]
METASFLARRLAETHGVEIQRAAFASTPPVRSTVERIRLEPPRTGRLTVVTRSAATASGDGAGVGVPVAIEDLGWADRRRPVIACATRDWNYQDVAAAVNAALEAGREVAAVITANDEAVLVGNRLTARLPVVDDVDVQQLLSADLVAVETRHGAAPLQQLTDPFWLVSALNLQESERHDASAIADQLFDSKCAVVSFRRTPLDGPATPPYCSNPEYKSDTDLGQGYAVPLADIAAEANSRRGSVDVDSLVVARTGGPDARPADSDDLAGILGVPVTEVGSEAAAGRAGALTTPGVSEDTVVVDVGGGTVDIVSQRARTVLPGAGQLLTAATAAALDISKSAAEYAKRAESFTAVTSQLVEDEHGRRHFLSQPLSGHSTGWLITSAPSGLLPFTSRLSSWEWRSWRHVAKRRIIGNNVLTGLRAGEQPGSVLLVGGGASDDELVRAVADQLGHQVAVGRGNVRGQLGHRFAVAYGLIVLGTQEG